MVVAVMTEASTEFAEWVTRFRIFLNLTQDRMADLLGVTPSAYQRWEYGTRRPSATAWTAFKLLAEKHGYLDPPSLDHGRGPRRRED